MARRVIWDAIVPIMTLVQWVVALQLPPEGYISILEMPWLHNVIILHNTL